ncbi:ATP-binding response regulator [Chitinophaga flava]|uniref:histidine kinase n=1 Tax=Chitinophaga flava TaxID=2259036 RepID=A0A365XYK0_9BACT|nr:hybrid sensor histidine kinase/response regulator [Chitinophaga flava]RBL90655.1 hypothetical protein DF182_29845 [Chitinophaga flava]
MLDMYIHNKILSGFINFLGRPLFAGTKDFTYKEDKRPVILVNALGLLMTILVLGIGSFFYSLHPSMVILLPILIEAAAFIYVIVLNHLKKYFKASLVMLIANSVFAVYWSTVFGTAIPIDLVMAFLATIVFHLCNTFFLSKERKVLVSCLIITVTALILVQVNQRQRFIAPLELAPDTAYIIHLITSSAFLALIILVMSSYIGKIHALLYSERKLKDASVAKSTFLRETYHELRTPLNAIYGIAQLLQLRRNGYSAEEKREIDDLYSACYIARNIINNVLDMSRIDAGRFNTVTKESLNLKECVGHCTAINQYIALSRGITIRESFDEQLPAIISSDKIILTKIINNLLSNAVKFATGNSCVEIRCQREQHQVIFRVINQGSINYEKAAQIFEAFVSERNQITEGTGLGLSITKHLVELLGGQIFIEPDEKNTHTIIAFTLPLEAARGKSSTASKQHYRRNVFPGATALVIEDDPISSSLLTKILSHMGLTATLCHTGEEAMELIQIERPDVIISDLHMSNMSGKELLQHLRSHPLFKDIPVLIVSGDAFTSVKEDILRAGANAYISKPVHFNELYLALSRHLPQFQAQA